jgi:hypothetical protein
MGILIVYFIGLLLGVFFYSMTFYFSKEMKNDKRKIITGIVGLVCFIVGLMMIGGFSGMPISLMGVGILTVASLLWFGGKTILWRKVILAIILLIALGGLSYVGLDRFNGSSFEIDEKDERLDPDLKNYYEYLQVHTDVKGFKAFDAYADDKAIILSLGGENKGNSLEVLNVENKGGRMIVNIRTFENQSSEKNPAIIILLDKLEPNIVIKDTDGTVYKEVQ